MSAPRLLCLTIALSVWLAAAPARAAQRLPPEIRSVPGQVSVVAANAKQKRILDVHRFARLLEFVKSLRTRPVAFNGGGREAVLIPDVIALQEMSKANIEIFARLLRRRSDFDYRIAGSTEPNTKLVYNTTTLTQDGDPVVWSDACYDDPAGERSRSYQYQRFEEKGTNASFVVATVHLGHRYRQSVGKNGCTELNIQEMKLQLRSQNGPVVVAGDFNRRAVQERYECDPDERSEPLQWWLNMVAPNDGSRAFVDSVKAHHRAAGVSLVNEWTHKKAVRSTLCDGRVGLKQTRIDYIFVSEEAVVAEGHTDHPGWADGSHYKYSDHRWLWSRVVVSGPPRASRPSAERRKNGVIELSWEPVSGATGWTLYRSNRGAPYRKIATLPGDALVYRDGDTEHGMTYRFAVAAMGIDGGHGLESRPVRERADARGPRVKSVRPAPGRNGVDIRANLHVFLNQRTAGSSVTRDAIKLVRVETGRIIRGRIVRISPTHIRFNPSDPLRKATSYRARVSGLRDGLGNVGPSYRWRFTTESPTKRRR